MDDIYETLTVRWGIFKKLSIHQMKLISTHLPPLFRQLLRLAVVLCNTLSGKITHLVSLIIPDKV